MTTGKVLEPRAGGGRRFEGKIAVVAGAGQGIGSATCRRLAQEGATVVIGDWVEVTAQRVADELKDFGATAITHIGDYSKWEDCESIMKRAKDAYGRIDTMVAIVGGTIWFQSYWYYTPQQIVTEVNKSFWPTMWLVRAVLPTMIEQRSGSIVTLATHAVTGKFRVPYAASKGGLMGLTTSLCKEVAEFGIRINCVAPSSVGAEDRVTPRNHNVSVPANELPPDERDRQRRYREEDRRSSQPMGRGSTAEEQASAIAFLASDDASFISGQILPVGGGETYPF